MILEVLEAGTNPAYLSETLTSGWIDVTSIENLNAYSTRATIRSTGTIADYKLIRNEISTLLAATTFAALSVPEKMIVCNMFLVSVTDRDTIYTTAQQIGLGQLFNKYSVGARTLRVSKASSEIYNRLTKTEALQIVKDVTTTDSLFFDYINFGVEGTVEDGAGQEGLFDYMLSRAGTPWATTGFSSYGYTPIGYANMSDFADDLMVVLKDGIY